MTMWWRALYRLPTPSAPTPCAPTPRVRAFAVAPACSLYSYRRRAVALYWQPTGTALSLCLRDAEALDRLMTTNEDDDGSSAGTLAALLTYAVQRGCTDADALLVRTVTKKQNKAD